MFGRFRKTSIEAKPELKLDSNLDSTSKNNYDFLSDSFNKELAQEEYNIKWEIYALTKNLDVMSMTLEQCLRYKMHEDLKYQDYKQKKYDLTTGLPKLVADVNLVNLFFQFECLNNENRLDEVATYIEKMARLYDGSFFSIATYLSYAYLLNDLHKKPCNSNLTDLLMSGKINSDNLSQ